MVQCVSLLALKPPIRAAPLNALGKVVESESSFPLFRESGRVAIKASQKECMTVSSKVRIYDLAKELKLDTKRLIEEVRREGVDVSVPSNSVSKELAEKIRNKYFPKKEAVVKRGVRVVKRAERAVEEPAPAETFEAAPEPDPDFSTPSPQ